MFVNEVNDAKIYNLSAGKTVPEWLTDRRKRNKILKKVDSRRQIELIQDFDMPTVSTSIGMTPDQQYILAAGTYKPRLKCFEVCNLSIKFERCFDSEVSAFEVLSDDYSKIALLQCDRCIEIHSSSGRHYRLRIPRVGLDMKYHRPSCDLFVVGSSKDIYRLNLERGQFLKPYETDCSSLNVCDINSEHGLLVVGAKEGIVEAWDPRTNTCCSSLDVAIRLENCNQFPSVSAITFKKGLEIGVGTASGHVLLYDIRSRQPLIIKDHINKVPIKRIAFNTNQKTVYSMDEVMLKLWNQQTGKQVAYIESPTKFNDFCTIDSTGIFFLAQEDCKMLTYYIPAMGPAPRWCSFLDNLTEEIESEVVEHIFDDYQFVTAKELEELGLDNLIGTSLLKGYMHGFFMDVRLYNKAKALVSPFAFEQFRKENIRNKIESERKSRLNLEVNLPPVNQELAMRLMYEDGKISNGSTPKSKPNLMQDSRFKAMFANADFAINKNAEEYKVLAPVLNKLEKRKEKELKIKSYSIGPEFHAHEDSNHPDSDNDEDLFGITKSNIESNSATDSSDDENKKEYVKEIKRVHKELKKNRGEYGKETANEVKETESTSLSIHKEPTNMKKLGKKVGIFETKYPYKETNRFNFAQKDILHNRVKRAEEIDERVKVVGRSIDNRKMTFSIRKNCSREEMKKKNKMKKHQEDRKSLVRPIKSLKLKKIPLK